MQIRFYHLEPAVGSDTYDGEGAIYAHKNVRCHVPIHVPNSYITDAFILEYRYLLRNDRTTINVPMH